MTTNRRRRSFASAVSLLMVTAACGPEKTGADEDSGGAIRTTSGDTSEAPGPSGDSGDSPTATGDVPPENCVPKEVEGPTEAHGKCAQYMDVKGCCGAKSLYSGTDGDEFIIPHCALSFDTKKDGTLAPAECPQLVSAAFDCALVVAAESCLDLRVLVDAVWDNYDKSKGNQPPMDASIPCYAEVISAWNAGCEPNML